MLAIPRWNDYEGYVAMKLGYDHYGPGRIKSIQTNMDVYSFTVTSDTTCQRTRLAHSISASWPSLPAPIAMFFKT